MKWCVYDFNKMHGLYRYIKQFNNTSHELQYVLRYMKQIYCNKLEKHMLPSFVLSARISQDGTTLVAEP